MTNVKTTCVSVALGCAAALAAPSPAAALPVDVELVFFVDYSGSNEIRRQNLAGEVQGFLDALTADPDIATARMAVMGSFGGEPVLYQDLTDDAALLESAITDPPQNGGGATDEDYLESLLHALPNLPQILADLGIDPDGIKFPDDPDDDPDIAFLGIDYSPDALKSFVLLADESEQSSSPWNFYKPIFDASGFLMNLIIPAPAEPIPGQPAGFPYSCTTDLLGFPSNVSGDSGLPRLANPADAIFSICEFDADPAAFFAGFGEAKVREFRTVAGLPPEASTGAEVPIGPAAPLLVGALAALGLAARRRAS